MSKQYISLQLSAWRRNITRMRAGCTFMFMSMHVTDEQFWNCVTDDCIVLGYMIESVL